MNPTDGMGYFVNAPIYFYPKKVRLKSRIPFISTKALYYLLSLLGIF